MRVLVWQMYGQVRVFHAESPMDFFKIHECLKKEMHGWGAEKILGNLFEAMGKVKSAAACEREFNGFVRPHLNSHELFEQFEFTNVEGT